MMIRGLLTSGCLYWLLLDSTYWLSSGLGVLILVGVCIGSLYSLGTFMCSAVLCFMVGRVSGCKGGGAGEGAGVWAGGCAADWWVGWYNVLLLVCTSLSLSYICICHRFPDFWTLSWLLYSNHMHFLWLKFLSDFIVYLLPLVFHCFHFYIFVIPLLSSIFTYVWCYLVFIHLFFFREPWVVIFIMLHFPCCIHFILTSLFSFMVHLVAFFTFLYFVKSLVAHLSR